MGEFSREFLAGKRKIVRRDPEPVDRIIGKVPFLRNFVANRARRCLPLA